MSGDIFYCHNWQGQGSVLASSTGHEVLNILQCTGSLPAMNYPAKNVSKEGLGKSCCTLFKIIGWDINVFIHSLTIPSISTNIQTRLETSIELTAVHMLLPPRYNQPDHIFLFSTSKQHLEDHRTTQHCFPGTHLYMFLSRTGIRFNQFIMELGASENINDNKHTTHSHNWATYGSPCLHLCIYLFIHLLIHL